MKFTYSLTSETLYIDNLAIEVYGITVEYEENGVLIYHTINDITTDRHKLQKLVELCNTYKLDVCHLDDVINDFLGMQSF